jgi:DNA-binding protein HU-beta
MAGKADLVAGIAAETGLSRVQAAKAVNAAVSAITRALANGESVTLTGFGTFKVVRTSERMGRNPATGQAIKIAAGKRIGFSAGSRLSSAPLNRLPGRPIIPPSS